MSNPKQRLHLGLVLTAAATAILVALNRGGLSTTSVVTMLMAIELTIRFRYIIGLLDWPTSASRLLLLIGFWGGMIVLASQVNDPHRWAQVAAMLFGVGIAIEVHNLVTRQWAIGDARFQRSLRNDVLRGIASAAFAAASTLIVAARWPDWIVLYVGGLIAADVIRFLDMVFRHRRLRAAMNPES